MAKIAKMRVRFLLLPAAMSQLKSAAEVGFAFHSGRVFAFPFVTGLRLMGEVFLHFNII